MSQTISPDPVLAFAALGDPTRLAIVKRLAETKECSIGQLGTAFPMSRQALTKHLRVLEQARLVRSERFGREVRFRLEQAELEHAQAFLNHVSRQWRGALHRLSKHLQQE